MAEKKHITRFLFAVAAFLLVHCSTQPSSAGAGSETTNSLTGALANTDKTPASFALVRLIPHDYDGIKDPPPSQVQTDTAGRYLFVNVDTGLYNIEAVSIARRTRALVCAVHAVGGRDTVPTDTLFISGTVKIMIPASLAVANGYVYVPGTTVAALLSDTGGFVVLDSVPAKKMIAVNYALRNGVASPRRIGDSISVTPGGMATISFPEWKFSKKLGLNTSSSGAGVSGDVVGFPVLIRLTSGNFTFSQARPGGSDMRFTKSDGTPLAYEIESWDSSAAAAAIWVMVDTLFGNNSSQSITMYWGNSNSVDNSNSAAVFDTANGFLGVWHLAQAGNTTAFDATANHYDGTPSGMSAASAVAGNIGVAQKFDGTSSYVTLVTTAGSRLNFPQRGTYSISAWVYADTLDSSYQVIVGKGEHQYSLQILFYNKWEYFDYVDQQQYEATRCDAKAREWTLLTAVRYGAKEYFYVNGTVADSVLTITTSDSARTTNADVTIGKRADIDPDQRFFKGIIDEVRIQNVACGPDWARLCYMNQKADDALVKW
jgi:hypothetical protein